MPKPKENLEKLIQDVQALEDALWLVVKKNAQGLSSDQVIDCFKEITDTIYDAGIDGSWDLIPEKIFKGIAIKNTANAWDLVWLSPLAIALHREQKKLTHA